MSEIESYYDKKSRTYDVEFDNLYFKVYDTITWRYLEPYVPTSSSAIILDAGGGTGRWTIPMAKKGCKVVLLDISEGMLDVAKKKIDAEGLQDRVIIQKGDITKINYPEGAFDMVLCEHALFLFPDPSIVIRELVRVLKQNCPLIVSASNKYVAALNFVPKNPRKGVALLHGQYHFTVRSACRLRRRTYPEVYLVTPNEFERLLAKNGLKVEKIVGKGVTMPLRIPPEIFFKRDYSRNFLNEILQIELALCEKPDALGLAGHLQAIAYKV